MKYCMEITCVCGCQLQNDVINLIASIDQRPSFVKSETKEALQTLTLLTTLSG